MVNRDERIAVLVDRQLAQETESPIEHVAHTASCAMADLDAAIWQATSRAELQVLRTLAEALITRLEGTAAAALTLDEHFEDMRSR